jgi:hypothetical protein
MKYSMKSLDFAIDTLAPNIKTAKEAGIRLNRPESLQLIARDLFVIKVLDRDYDPSYKEMLCTYVVAEALRDLQTIGWFEFGTKELENEV